MPLKETGELEDSLKQALKDRSVSLASFERHRREPCEQQAGALPDEGLFGFFLYSGKRRVQQSALTRFLTSFGR